MTQAASDQPLDPAQRTRLSGFSATISADIHCHCLQGLDDGPESMERSIELCRALVADGITHVIATPHQLGPFSGTNGRAVILEALNRLKEQLSANQIPLKVEPGADIRIDPGMLELLDSRQLLTLGDGKGYILLELPQDALIEPAAILKELAARGIRGILSHPERYASIARNVQLAMAWIQGGALLQVTSGSLLGEFGPHAQTAAWQLIEGGAVSLIASDAHDVQRRPPRMTQAIRAISTRLGHAVARRLCIENPGKIFSGQPIQPPRITRRFGGRA